MQVSTLKAFAVLFLVIPFFLSKVLIKFRLSHIFCAWSELAASLNELGDLVAKQRIIVLHLAKSFSHCSKSLYARTI